MDREKAIDEAKFSSGELREALVERHSEETQQKLEQGRVAIAGLGGLGSNVAIALTRIGVGHLHLLDFDRVDLTNLNRQQYFLDQVGRYKTEALSETLQRINPYLDIRFDTVKITDENIKELFQADEIVCEAFDVPEYKAMLVSGILEHFPEKKLIAASGRTPLPYTEEEFYQGLSAVVTVVVSLWSWWKNNSFTAKAIRADHARRK